MAVFSHFVLFCLAYCTYLPLLYAIRPHSHIKVLAKNDDIRPWKDNDNDINLAASLQHDGTVADAGSTIPSAVFNLAKTILGAGVLSLPAGVAMGISDTPSALVLASALLVGMGIMSAYSFASIGRSCRYTGTDSLADTWRDSVSARTSKLIAAMVTCQTFMACLGFSIIIGESVCQILQTFGFQGRITNRTNVILGMTGFFIFPLCCLRKLDALKYTSILGMLGVVYCAVFMALRYFDGSYAQGGQFFQQISPELAPAFGIVGAKRWFMVFAYMSMLLTSFAAHFNAPKFLTELRNPTLPRYYTVTALSFAVSIGLYLAILFSGFLTFGAHSTGLVLNNYASTDVLATSARAAIAIGIITGYPLTFVALRDGLFDILQYNQAARDKSTVLITAAVVAVITALAVKVTDLGAVISFGGALIGSCIVFLVPAILNICRIRAQAAATTTTAGGKEGLNSVVYTTTQRLELLGNLLMGAIAVVTAVFGVTITAKGLE